MVRFVFISSKLSEACTFGFHKLLVNENQRYIPSNNRHNLKQVFNVIMKNLEAGLYVVR